jgi:transcription termination/antitermination protein NusG
MSRFQIGQPVRILDGPFVNFVGVVRDAPASSGSIQVAVAVQGREVVVEVDQYRLEVVR